MAKRSIIAVFVHGWSVTNTKTYGGLPARLRKEAKSRGLDLAVKHVFLGRYISFHDEVRVEDVSKAFRTAVDDELGGLLAGGARFICITHSTGGPVIRDWWHRFYDGVRGSGVCPMSHLIMLAPANYGSALAQLGKGRISRLKSWFGGVEPGQGVLDWLELGSSEAWDLNSAWIKSDDKKIGAGGIFPFVLTGQRIDRKFYDHLNTYTGETGSDGVVRVAAANLNGRLIELQQELPRKKAGTKGTLEAPVLKARRMVTTPTTALRVVRLSSHSGTRMGIMRSVRGDVSHNKGADVTEAIFECLAVQNKNQYQNLVESYEQETTLIQQEEQLEIEDRLLLSDTRFIHDRYAMVIFRIRDDQGYAVTDFDLLLTAGEESDPDHLPKGFYLDHQLNRVNRNTITFFFNYDVMVGTSEVRDGDEVVRERTAGATSLGIRLSPRPSQGFVHYLPCEIKATKKLLSQVIQPNSTTMVDIRLQRVVKKNVFRLARMQGDKTAGNFKKTKPGDDSVS